VRLRPVCRAVQNPSGCVTCERRVGLGPYLGVGDELADQTSGSAVILEQGTILRCSQRIGVRYVLL
jgi:hypothetical protein